MDCPGKCACRPRLQRLPCSAARWTPAHHAAPVLELQIPHLWEEPPTEATSPLGKSRVLSHGPRRHFQLFNRVSTRCTRVTSQLPRHQTCLVEPRSLKGHNYYVNVLLFIPPYASLLTSSNNAPVFVCPFITCTQWLFSYPFFSSFHLPSYLYSSLLNSNKQYGWYGNK